MLSGTSSKLLNSPLTQRGSAYAVLSPAFQPWGPVRSACQEDCQGCWSGGLASAGHLLHLAKSPATDLWELWVSQSTQDSDSALLCFGFCLNLSGIKHRWM